MEYDVNDRIKAVRLALNLPQRTFIKGIHLKSAGNYGDIETHRIKVNERIIELVSSVYGVSLVWLKTGKGKMFEENRKADNELEQMNIFFNELNPHFKKYVLTQIKNLLKLQKMTDTK